MYDTACVVNFHLPSDRLNPGTCCGIVVDSRNGLVLTHTSCLGLFIEKGYLDPAESSFNLDSLNSLNWEVLLQKVEARKVVDHSDCGTNFTQAGISPSDVSTNVDTISKIKGNGLFQERGNSYVTSISNSTKAMKRKKPFHTLTTFSARVIGLSQCQILADSLEKLMPESSWELLDKSNAKGDSKSARNKTMQDNPEMTEAAQKRLLSSFMLLKVESWTPYSFTLNLRPARGCQVGDAVQICSTPFGGLKPEVFMNSYSQGILSNLTGTDNCVLLSDARCILGGEGAPLYTFGHGLNPERYLTGIIIASLVWKNEEWVGFCIACDVGAVFDSFSGHHALDHNLNFSPTESGATTLTTQKATLRNPKVVMVEVGGTWGSGVIVDQGQGVVLTCSHVVKGADKHTVRIKRAGHQPLQEATVLFRQHSLQRQFDLAVVRCKSGGQLPSSLKHETLHVCPPTEGMRVFVIGHALFGPEHHLQPSLTAGVISKVISLKGVPIMIQTTCAVHPGASGGALVDTRGRLLGIVVCNARDNASGATFPHINMSIPACTVWPVVSKFLQTADVNCLKNLTLRNDLVDNIWALKAIHDTATSSLSSKL